MKVNLYLLVAFFSIAFGYSQDTLPDFTLKVKVTDETCLGNGTLVSTVSDTVAQATVTYLIYKLPETSIPISSNPTINGLSSGKYRVIATQTLGGKFNTQQKDVEIINKVVDLKYHITSNSVGGCGVTGAIIVMVDKGDPEFYEIIKGPKTYPKQTSNTFPDLPAGQYRIRVYDKCGEALVRDYILSLVQPILNVGSTITPENLTSCNSLVVGHELTPNVGTVISYPLHVVCTVHPPNGNPDKIIIQNIPSGPSDLYKLSLALDLYGNSDFTYDLKITDKCGNDFILNGNGIGPFPQLVLVDVMGKCAGKYLSIVVSNFSPAYNVKFTKSPAGFDPKVFNSAHPGPFSNGTTTYGNSDKPVPFGIYEVEITDACGRTSKTDYEVKVTPIEPTTSTYNAGCDSKFGNIQIGMPDKSKIVAVKITKAPAEYQPALPSDVSSLIDAQGIFFIQNIPVGKYDFAVTDDCGKLHVIQGLEIPVFVKQGLIGQSLPNCVVGSGSVLVYSGNGALKSIQITKAPDNLGKTLPYDVSFNLFGGQLVMSDLPTGDYEFKGIDACDYELVLALSVIGYNRSEPGFSVGRNCGSFNLSIADSSNGVYKQVFWLQKFNPSANVWEEPFTEVAYNEGSVPNVSNAFPIGNNSTAYNLTTMGNFRVIKTFQSYATAANPSMYKDCIEILGEFEFDDQLKIMGVYSLDCLGGAGSMSVVIDVLGVPPYTYTITEKDGDTSFIVDNGSNNVFSDLTPATYNFQVQDSCEALKNGKYTVGALPKLVEAHTPGTLLECGDGRDQFTTFDLTKQDVAIVGNQNPNNYKVSYYLNSTDADTGTNPIANPNFFVNTSNPQTIYARLINTGINLCYDTTPFEVFLGVTPVLSASPPIFVCEGESTVLNADPGYDAYEWSTGATTSFIEVTEPGVYNVKVKNVYADVSCDASKDITVTGSGPAHFEKIEINDLSDTSNSINVIVSGIGNYEYSLDNVNFQSDSFFNDVKAGQHSIYVRDKNGCGTVNTEVLVLSYPRVFTPNGDGVNDKWKIDSSSLEPGLKVYVYDRFGKLIVGLDSFSSGWDGSYNGELMPSTDYWFKLERSDGRVYKGHFAMKR